MLNILIDKLIEIAEKDESIIYLSGSVRNESDHFAKKLPNQYLNTGIAEQNMIGLATGLALEGRKVFIEGQTNFIALRCIEQIRNDAVHHEVNINIIARGAGFYYGELGPSHHGLEDMAIIKSLPITLLSPCSNFEVTELLPQIVTHPGVSYLRLDRSIHEDFEDLTQPVVIGNARWLMQGTDAVILSCNSIIQEALLAAKALRHEGLQIGVISVHTVNPIDKAMIRQIAKITDNLITLEEHCLAGGLGSTISEICMDEGLHINHFIRLGLKNGNCRAVGSQEYLRRYHELDSNSLKLILTKLLKINRAHAA